MSSIDTSISDLLSNANLAILSALLVGSAMLSSVLKLRARLKRLKIGIEEARKGVFELNASASETIETSQKFADRALALIDELERRLVDEKEENQKLREELKRLRSSAVRGRSA